MLGGHHDHRFVHAAGQHPLHGMPQHGLALEHQEQLGLPHAPGQPRRQHHADDHAASSKKIAPRSEPRGFVRLGLDHFTAAAAASMARFAKTLQRCVLYSTDPWRSGWTSMPSAAFSAAAWMLVASAGLPVIADSTPLALTALVPAPVTPTLALLILPPSMVRTAATPTMANRDAG